jgi:hypothetical protein
LKSPLADYDPLADVLHVSVDPVRPDFGEDRPRGVILRFAAKDNRPSGATVVGLAHNGWSDDVGSLGEIIAEHLGYRPGDVVASIEEAVARDE